MTPYSGDSSSNNPVKETITVKYLRSSFSDTNNATGWKRERCARIKAENGLFLLDIFSIHETEEDVVKTWDHS